jgi:microcystin-dependent protein
MAQTVTVAPTVGAGLLFWQDTTTGFSAIDRRRWLEAAHAKMEGVYEQDAWAVSESAVPAMTVDVAADVGLARVDGTTVDHQGAYVIAPHSATIELDVTASDPTNPRIDIVVLQVRDDTHDASGANDARVRIIDGTPTSGATKENGNGAASLPASSLLLGRIQVDANATEIEQSDILDFRLHAGTDTVGRVATFAGDPDPGWFVREGGTLNRTTHARLFAKISTTYGAGDGSTTFGLGDMRGRVGVHPDGSAGRLSANDTLGAAGGTESHTLDSSQIPSHSHADGSLTAASGAAGIDPGSFVVPYAGGVSWIARNPAAGSEIIPVSTAAQWQGTSTVHSHDVTGSTGATGGGGSHPNTQPYLVNGKEYIYAGALGTV